MIIYCAHSVMLLLMILTSGNFNLRLDLKWRWTMVVNTTLEAEFAIPTSQDEFDREVAKLLVEDSWMNLPELKNCLPALKRFRGRALQGRC